MNKQFAWELNQQAGLARSYLRNCMRGDIVAAVEQNVHHNVLCNVYSARSIMYMNKITHAIASII